MGREIIEVGKMYRRRWAGKSGKGNTFNTSVWRSFLRNERQGLLLTGKMGRESGQGKGGKGTFIIGNIYEICTENRLKDMHENLIQNMHENVTSMQMT